MTDHQNSSAGSASARAVDVIQCVLIERPEIGKAEAIRIIEALRSANLHVTGNAAQCVGMTVASVAAIIDPVAFDPISLDDKHPGWECRREQATETAKKIVALAQPSPAATAEPFDVMSTIDPDHAESFDRHNGSSADSEPAAWVNGDELDNLLDDRTTLIQGTQSGWRRTPLYRAVPQAVAWQPIETAPMDTNVLMAWFYESQWEIASGWAGSTKGGYLHSQATHWKPLPTPPVSRPHGGRE
jgi:hypothetical protein